ncbi:MAG: hypothetical protein VW230_04435 [Candidatus Poseidoniales archaeon]
MKYIHFRNLEQDVRASLQGHRWLIIQGSEIKHATTALMFSELEDILVAVDLRGHQFVHGLWERATHLCILDTSESIEQIRKATGITKVLQGDDIDLLSELW